MRASPSGAAQVEDVDEEPTVVRRENRQPLTAHAAAGLACARAQGGRHLPMPYGRRGPPFSAAGASARPEGRRPGTGGSPHADPRSGRCGTCPKAACHHPDRRCAIPTRRDATADPPGRRWGRPARPDWPAAGRRRGSNGTAQAPRALRCAGARDRTHPCANDSGSWNPDETQQPNGQEPPTTTLLHRSQHPKDPQQDRKTLIDPPFKPDADAPAATGKKNTSPADHPAPRNQPA